MNRIEVVNDKGKIYFQVKDAYSNNSCLSLCYEAKGNMSEVELEKATSTINNLFNDVQSVGVYSIESFVYQVKTVFRKFDEKKLSIDVICDSYDATNVNCSVRYKDGKLVLYRKQLDKEIGTLEFEFSKGNGIRYNSLNKDITEFTFDEEKAFDFFVSQEKDHLRTLKNNSGARKKGDTLSFSSSERCLCSAYRLFYNENPDFSNYVTVLKAQAMVMMLEEHGCNVAGLEEGFVRYSRLPSNQDFDNLCYKLSPFGEIDKSMCSANFTNSDKRKIEEIGSFVTDYIEKAESNKDDVLKNLIVIYYCRKKCMPWGQEDNVSALSKRYSVDSKEVSKCLALIKKVENR